MGLLPGLGRMAARRRAALWAAVAFALLAALAAADARRPPAGQLTSRAAISGIRWYQARVSPHLGTVCRFKPSCSVYATTVIERYGAVRGGWMAVRRIARCGPWTAMGTKDPPP